MSKIGLIQTKHIVFCNDHHIINVYTVYTVYTVYYNCAWTLSANNTLAKDLDARSVHFALYSVVDTLHIALCALISLVS